MRIWGITMNLPLTLPRAIPPSFYITASGLVNKPTNGRMIEIDVRTVTSPRDAEGPQARRGAGNGGSTPCEPADRRAARTPPGDRKSTRLNSSHVKISYAVFCLKKKKKKNKNTSKQAKKNKKTKS